MKLTNLKKSVVASLVASVFGTLLCSAVYAADANKPGAGVSITPIFPTIAEERFRGEVVIAGLKELGYEEWTGAPQKLAERGAKERAMWATVTQGIVVD